MEVIFALAGLALGLFILLCPIILLVWVLNARNRISALEQTTAELRKTITRLTLEQAGAGHNPQVSTATEQSKQPVSTTLTESAQPTFASVKTVSVTKTAEEAGESPNLGELGKPDPSPRPSSKPLPNREGVLRSGEELGWGQSNRGVAGDSTPLTPTGFAPLASLSPEGEGLLSLNSTAMAGSPPSQEHELSDDMPQFGAQADHGRAEEKPRHSQKPDPWLEASSYRKSTGNKESHHAWIGKLKTWLFGGNLVAKVGLLILFLGVSFLLKYAAQRIIIPIEFRLLGIVLADLALLGWAWHIRERRPLFSLPVQGAAIAILMLVTFGAYKLYGLFPGSMAFALLFLLTAFTCLLAVLQDALWLAIFGIAGGFAAPLLTTTGGGNHIGLFSYYAILNAGILVIALYRSWRLLNLIGFAFTFVIGTAWGVFRYTPEHYLSAQLFLMLFFGFYVLISLLYASRQAPNLKHYVDGTLVFGIPLVAFGLQYGLVKHIEFGLAYSALALGLFYIGTAVWLWQKQGTTLKLLTESFLALGVVFGTLAIPFALDGRWTSAAWALEGAGMVWVGLRQRQTMAWMFGLFVQFGAWLSFMGSVSGLDRLSAAESNLWLGFLLLSATAFLMAINFRNHAEKSESNQPNNFSPFATVFLAWAGIWMLAGAWTEIGLRSEGVRFANLLAVSGLLVAMILGVIARQMHWQVARTFSIFAQILAGLVFLWLAAFNDDYAFNSGQSLFAGPFLGGLLIALGAFFSSLFFHRQNEAEWSTLSRWLLGWAGFWWFAFVLHDWAWWVQDQYRLHQAIEAIREDSLFWCAYGLSVAMLAPVFALMAKRLHWIALRWFGVSVWLGLGFATFGLLDKLYLDEGMPYREAWLTYLALWAASEWLLFCWQRSGWLVTDFWLKNLHVLRTVGPWLMIWPVGRWWILAWLDLSNSGQQELLAEAGWFTSGSWARYVPAWVMMLVIVWLIRHARQSQWPVTPLADWYRQRLIPLAVGWSICLVIGWNLTQNGQMAPLPYLPILNPLDVTTGFSLILVLELYRLLQPDEPNSAKPAWLAKLPWFAALSGYAWLNLMLLRSVAVYMGIPYQVEPLFESQFIQTLLSLVWSVTALILMRVAAQRVWRKSWMLGAVLLGIVVGKLFLVDLSNVGGLERVVSFVGVGLLMLAIGYLAPFPSELDRTTGDEPPGPPKL